MSALATLRLLHFLGFAMAVGGAFAAARAIRLAREHSAASRAGIEAAARKIVTSVEILGLMIALVGGIGLLVQHPAHFSVQNSGAGPWLHIKLTFVLLVLVVSHLKMFRLARLVRERESGATEAECDALLGKAKALGSVGGALYAVIFFIAVFRYVLFGAG